MSEAYFASYHKIFDTVNSDDGFKIIHKEPSSCREGLSGFRHLVARMAMMSWSSWIQEYTFDFWLSSYDSKVSFSVKKSLAEVVQ